ncbi:fimbrial protein [Porphyromonas levii]|uniref:fimbrial protein n=1 Tax=Porphyromonas levii TaxID=28114 RepID=UPI001FD30B05|nr:fimbrial protein [Porphyromonas levii]
MPNNQEVTYLQFSMSGVLASSSQTRVQKDDPSIDTDTDDYEDFVDKVAVLVYDATEGGLVKSLFTTYKSFTMELKQSKYHFCFVANYPSTWNLEQLNTYDDFKSALKTMQTFNPALYDGATSNSTGNKFFPMSRIYENQDIPNGGTITSPIPFQPKTAGNGSIAPISSGTSKETGRDQSTVNLVRTSAKISLDLKGEGLKNVKKIELYNIAKQHSYMEVSTGEPAMLPDPAARLFKGSDKIIIATTATEFSTKMYIPERLLGKGSATLGWNKDSDTPVGTPTYIQIEMTSGKLYKIPVIINDPSQWGTDKYYIDVARNQEKDFPADYSIVRNHDYHFSITIPEDGKELDIALKVMPWDLIESELQFTQPEYECSLKVVNTKTNATRDLDDIFQEVLLSPNEIVEVTFEITKPVGAIWSASITNGLNYLFTGKTYDRVKPDIIGANPSNTYTFQIKPRQEFTTEPYYTQFYIVVDGKELNLYPKRSRNSYMDGGGSQRWRIKQVMY